LSEYVYTPSVCKPSVVKKEGEADVTVPAKFTGTVTIKLPGFDKRAEYAEQAALIDKSNEELYQIRRMRCLVKASEAHYVNVALKRLSDGKTYNSFDDVSEDTALLPVLVEVVQIVLDGPKEGNG
jgi:hypothetical protein